MDSVNMASDMLFSRSILYVFYSRNGPLTRYINCGLRIRRECRLCFPRHRFQRTLLVSDPSIYHGTCRDARPDRKPTVAGKTCPCTHSVIFFLLTRLMLIDVRSFGFSFTRRTHLIADCFIVFFSWISNYKRDKAACFHKNVLLLENGCRKMALIQQWDILFQNTWFIGQALWELATVQVTPEACEIWKQLWKIPSLVLNHHWFDFIPFRLFN